MEILYLHGKRQKCRTLLYLMMYLIDQNEEHYSILYSFQTYLCQATVSDKFVTWWQKFYWTIFFFWISFYPFNQFSILKKKTRYGLNNLMRKNFVYNLSLGRTKSSFFMLAFRVSEWISIYVFYNQLSC